MHVDDVRSADLDHEPAVAVYEGLLSGRLNEFSIGYAVTAEHREKSRDFGEYNVLDSVEVLEVSVVHAGANRFTRVLEVKSNDNPPDAAETLGNVLAHREARLKRYYADLNARIDAPVQRVEVDPGAVDRLVADVKLEMVTEALERSEQAAWEERMRINLVLDPVPVRVDGRMRPVTS